jgi:hypothetical protein
MHHAWLICLKDLRQRSRDHTALVVAVVAPLALTALVGMSLSGSQGFRMRLGIADLDGSTLSHAFVAFVQRPWLKGIIEVRQIGSRHNSHCRGRVHWFRISCNASPSNGLISFASPR